MKPTARLVPGDLTLLVLLAAGIFLASACTRDFWIYDEGRRALIAAEMLARGEWAVPRLAGTPILTKPPLFYWLAAGAFALTGGPSDWGARLPSLLGALIALAAVWAMAGRLWGRAAALLAGLALIGMPIFYWMGQHAEPDTLFAGFGAAAMAGFALLNFPAPVERGGWPLRVVLWTGLGAAAMTKGPLVPVIVLVTLAIFGLLRRERPRLWAAHLAGGAAALAGAPALWLAFVRRAGYSPRALWSEVQMRLEGGAPHQEHALYYWEKLDAFLFPWNFVLLAALAAGGAALVIRVRGDWRRAAREARSWLMAGRGERLFSVLWFTVSFVVLSAISSKRYYYAVVLAPPAALLVGLMYHEWMGAVWPRLSAFVQAKRTALVGVLAVGAVISAVAAKLVNWPDMPDALSGASSPETRLLLCYLAGLLAGFSLILFRRGRSVADPPAQRPVVAALLFWTAAMGIALTLAATFWLHPLINRRHSLRLAADEIQRRLPAGAPLVAIEDNYTVLFYLNRWDVPVIEVGQWPAWAQKHPDSVGLAFWKNYDDLPEAERWRWPVLYVSDFIEEEKARVVLLAAAPSVPPAPPSPSSDAPERSVSPARSGATPEGSAFRAPAASP
ncbi:MAG: hypothetical protein Kow0059_08700 [Candidatus Sumerlaeia bacterium]